ncbi:MAG: hypothetical protein ACRELT_04230 [Longimicrobiales bacterium]
MKRCAMSRPASAAHEAGHVVVIAVTAGLELGDFTWRRLAEYEISYARPRERARGDWEDAASRNALIARQAAVALAGGAAERLSAGGDDAPGVDAIHRQAGKVDFELAHEWLTLQRYDPDQRTLEREIARLYGAVSDVVRRHSHVVAHVAARILARLRLADAEMARSLSFPASELVDGLGLVAESVDFTLDATLMRHVERRTA